MKSPKANQVKELATVVFASLKGLAASKWNREPNPQNDERVALNSFYGAGRTGVDNTVAARRKSPGPKPL